jgi:regulator of sigma E protease
MIDVIYTIIALSILIVVHEFGHFIIARLVNVKVITFSLGFGKKLFHWKKGDTEYAISAMPLGGYVKLLGESPDEEVLEEEKERSFTNKTPFQRFLIVFAGPVFNLLFSLVVYYAFFAGGFMISPRIGHVEPGYPAYEAGIRTGDLIVSIGETKIVEWNEIKWEMFLAKPGPVRVVIDRAGKNIELDITPKEVAQQNLLGSKMKQKQLGIGPVEPLKTNILTSVPLAFHQTYFIIKQTFMGIYMMIAGRVPTKEIGGPIAILQVGSKLAEGGILTLISFAAMISINLGILNLLPIPVLDGGHILFNFIEIIIRRKVSEKTIVIAQKIGLTLLIMLMAFAFYNDIMRLVQTGFWEKIPGFKFFFPKSSP